MQQHLRRDAFALGGEPGAQHARAEGMPVSARTRLRLVRATPLPSTGSVRVLGVDDWARRRGRSYGTILVNLETHRAIDLLPDRTAATLAVWLRQHLEVEIISRDRGGAYADGARQGAPQALQIANRFPLRKNATDALERFLIRQHPILRQVAQPDDPVIAETPPPTAGGEPGDEAHQAGQVERRTRYEEGVSRRSQGSSISTIAARLGLSQRTVQRWIQAKQFPARRRRTERPTPLTPFVPYRRERWAHGGQNARRLWQDLHQRGYTGGYGSVAAGVRPWRGDQYRWRGQVQTRTRSAAADSALSPRQVCWLLLRPAPRSALTSGPIWPDWPPPVPRSPWPGHLWKGSARSSRSTTWTGYTRGCDKLGRVVSGNWRQLPTASGPIVGPSRLPSKWSGATGRWKAT